MPVGVWMHFKNLARSKDCERKWTEKNVLTSRRHSWENLENVVSQNNLCSFSKISPLLDLYFNADALGSHCPKWLSGSSILCQSIQFRLNQAYGKSPISAHVKYVNSFACQNYLRKIVVLCVSDSACQKRICGAQLSYVSSFDMHMYWHILHMRGQCIFI